MEDDKTLLDKFTRILLAEGKDISVVKYDALDVPDKPPSRTLRRHFGSWNNAKAISLNNNLLKREPGRRNHMKDIMNWIVISDLHSGCQLGLCSPNGVVLDEGGTYHPSVIQEKVWHYWNLFWNEWVPQVTRNEAFGIIINGDTLDGMHHGSTHQITGSLSDQSDIGYEILAPIVEKADGRLYMIRGTEAHVGPSGVEEERLAKRLGAIPNELGQYARYDLWKRVGNGLVHLLHHVGTTSSNAYEATAINKELTEEFNEAARWGEEVPDIIIRSHRHRHIKITIPSRKGQAIAEVTPGWQAKTPFTWRIAGARLAPPQFGGILVRQGDEEFYTRNKTWTIGRSQAE